ncbi:hypothetical protein SFRURICE_021496, partial [Spodoptera frugiperda]
FQFHGNCQNVIEAPTIVNFAISWYKRSYGLNNEMDSARVIFMIIILQNVLDCQGISIKDQILQLLLQRSRREQESPEDLQIYATSQPTSQEGDEDLDKPVARVIKDYYKIEQANKNKKAIIEAKIAKERELLDFPDPNYPQEDGGGPAEDPSMINMLDHAKPKRTHMSFTNFIHTLEKQDNIRIIS